MLLFEPLRLSKVIKTLSVTRNQIMSSNIIIMCSLCVAYRSSSLPKFCMEKKMSRSLQDCSLK